MSASRYHKRLLGAGLPVVSVAIADGNVYVSEWAQPPTPAQEAQAAQVIAATVPAEYAGVLCWDGADVDRETLRLISAALAPGKAAVQQEIARERMATELVVLLVKERVLGELPPEEQAALAAGLNVWGTVIAPIRAAGSAFKTAQGWDVPAESRKE